jgi:hypothetical protein
MTIPLGILTDAVEVLVFDSTAGPTLAGAIELVSPANKDHREAFVSKCETYLQQGIGLAIVDVVTERRGNLHGELLARLRPTEASEHVADGLYASAYRPVDRHREPSLDIWHETLAVGLVLPTLPLWLRGGNLSASGTRRNLRADVSRAAHSAGKRVMAACKSYPVLHERRR